MMRLCRFDELLYPILMYMNCVLRSLIRMQLKQRRLFCFKIFMRALKTIHTLLCIASAIKDAFIFSLVLVHVCRHRLMPTYCRLAPESIARIFTFSFMEALGGGLVALGMLFGDQSVGLLYGRAVEVVVG